MFGTLLGTKLVKASPHRRSAADPQGFVPIKLQPAHKTRGQQSCYHSGQVEHRVWDRVSVREEAHGRVRHSNVAMVTQMPNGDLGAGLDPSDMNHAPLGFVSGAFKKFNSRWSTLDEVLSRYWKC